MQWSMKSPTGRSIAAYQVLADSDRANGHLAMSKAKALGFDGVITMRLISNRIRATVEPGSGGFYSYYDGGMMVGYPGNVETEKITSIETRIYSVSDEALIWTGVSDTVDMTTIKKAVGEIAKAVKRAAEGRFAAVIRGFTDGFFERNQAPVPAKGSILHWRGAVMKRVLPTLAATVIFMTALAIAPSWSIAADRADSPGARSAAVVERRPGEEGHRRLRGKVTKEGSPDFVPPAERIATFDNDGTLWAEQPMYFQLAVRARPREGARAAASGVEGQGAVRLAAQGRRERRARRRRARPSSRSSWPRTPA